ncbi:NAD(P)H-binding protein [Salicibibacter cibi]|nr:NAD(P)H-binding protein [Salicibibacter cibi]
MKALVLGATGGMGHAIIKELTERNIEATAFARSHAKLEKMFSRHSTVTIHPGDIFTSNDIHAAADGVDLIFHAINIPYADWEYRLPTMNQNIIAAAKNHSAKLAVADNIYAYGRGDSDKTKETTPKHPHTKKGKIRLQMERLFKESEVPYLIAHFPDYYGPHAENAPLNYTLKSVAANKRTSFVGNPSIAREHIYTPDGAKAIIELALRDDVYNQNWNIPAYDTITGVEIIEIVRSMADYKKRVSTITKSMIRFLGFFNKQMREFTEMQYLNEDPVILSGKKYEKLIGPVPKTPYSQGIRETMAAYEQ